MGAGGGPIIGCMGGGKRGIGSETQGVDQKKSRKSGLRVLELGGNTKKDKEVGGGLQNWLLQDDRRKTILLKRKKKPKKKRKNSSNSAGMGGGSKLLGG